MSLESFEPNIVQLKRHPAINEQWLQERIVEARQFDADGGRFIVPALFGYTEEARRAKRMVTVASGRRGRRWTEQEFLTELSDGLEAPQAAAVRRILDAAKEAGLEIRWGTGTQRGSFNVVAAEYCPRSFASFLTDGEAWINLKWLNGSPETEQFRSDLARELAEVAGLPAKGTDTDFWAYQLEEWLPYAEGLVEVVRKVGVRWLDRW